MVVRTIILDCAPLQSPDAGTVHGIARLQLRARRHGGCVRVENAGTSLVDLIDLCGLTDALGIEMRRQAE